MAEFRKNGAKRGGGTSHPGTVGTRRRPLTVREHPSTRSGAVGALRKGTKVQIVAQAAGSRVSGTSAALLKNPYGRTTFHGKTSNNRTKAMLMDVERIVGEPLRISQGSYNSTVRASAGTHDGGGAADIGSTSLEICRAMRLVASPPGGGVCTTPTASRTTATSTASPSVTGRSPGSPPNRCGPTTTAGTVCATTTATWGPQVPKITFEEYLKTHGG